MHPEIEGEGIMNVNDRCKLKTSINEQELSPKVTVNDESREIVIPKFQKFVFPDHKINIFNRDEVEDELEINTQSYNFTELSPC